MEETIKQEIVTQAASLIRDNYVFPDLATKLANTLLDNYNNGYYSEINNSADLASTLTEDLQYISKDKHLEVDVNPHLIANLKSQTSEEQIKRQQDFARRHNYGFIESSILENSVGYLRFDGFFDTESNPEAVKVVADIMKIFSDVKTIIFDLRENTGGSPNMVQLISSYLFDERPVHLNSLYFRTTDSETEFWTLAEVEGKRYPDVQVFLLTSKTTFSAAEEFAYNLQSLKRATLIGEVTGGGAHPGDFHLIQEQIALFIPSGRAINPITKTNWEGTGVKPDIEVTASEALETALALASKGLNN